MSSISRYRWRRLDLVNMIVIEKRHERKAFGFWPVYDWILVKTTETPEEAVVWISTKSRAET